MQGESRRPDGGRAIAEDSRVSLDQLLRAQERGRARGCGRVRGPARRRLHTVARLAAPLRSSRSRAHPEAAAISGRTRYGGRGLAERALAVLSRAYVDPGDAGPTAFISNNNAILSAHRVPRVTRCLPTAGRLQRVCSPKLSAARAGVLLFEPTMCVVHDFAGLGDGTRHPAQHRLRDDSHPATRPAHALGVAGQVGCGVDPALRPRTHRRQLLGRPAGRAGTTGYAGSSSRSPSR